MNHKRITTRTMVLIGLVVMTLLAVIWWAVFAYQEQREHNVRQTWVALESQITQAVARSIKDRMESEAKRSPDTLEQTRQEIFDSYISPVQILNHGEMWVYVNGRSVFDRSEDFPQAFRGLSLAEIFEQQAQLGASDYEELVAGVMEGTSGNAAYTWLPEKGVEVAAWTSIDVLGERWTVGLSIPETEIFAFARVDQDRARNLVAAGTASLLLILIYALMLAQRRQDTVLMRSLEKSIAERTQDLVRSENRYRTLIENLREGILMIDPTAEQVLYTNPAVSDIFGKVKKDGSTQPLDITKLLMSDDCARLFAILKRQLVDPSPATGLYQAQTVNGSPLWLEVRSTRMEFEGRPVNVLLINNFTERKRTEAALRESEERYRGIFNGVQDAILQVDPAGSILDVNASACELFGFSRPEFLAKSLADITTPESGPSLAGLYGSGQTDQPVEAVGLRSGSRPFPIEITLRSHRLNGSSTSLVVVRDITARKEAEAAVEEAHRKIDVMMASVPDSLWSGELLSGGRLLIHYISPVFERITGYPSEPFCQDSRRWYEILHPDDRGMVEAEQQRFYTGQSSSLELEYRILKPDGTQRYVRDRQFIRPGGPGPTRVDGVLVDITEQKRVEQQFKKANRDLSITVKELQARHREVSLLNEMGDLLQSCTTLEDAYTVIARFSSQLFPGQSGALYIFNPSVEQAEIAATWGDRPPARAQMGTQDCWGLRRNRLHIYSEPGTGLRCSHVVRPNNPAYICAPLQAQGELIGLLHVLSDTHPIQERSAQLSETLARQVGLALINLRLRESLRVQATQDALTGLFNRRYMEGTLANMVSGRNSLDSLGLILLDIDRFKHCNDTFGHDAGDTLLMAFGKYLQRMFGSNNIVCRYGGDEFVVVLPGETIEETLKQAERLRSGFRQQRVYHQGELLQFNTLSLGAAAFPLHGATLTDLLRRADAALYEAKSAGGDHVAVARMD